MTPTLAYLLATAYLLGIVTLPGMLVGIGAALYVADRVAGWWRAPCRRWSALARGAGRVLARSGPVLDDYRMWHITGVRYGHTEPGTALSLDLAARRWARWCPWWPA